MSKTRTGRRQFLATAAVAPMILSAAAQQANDRLTMGLIGSGGRGRNVMAAFIELGAQVGAVCDIYEPNLLEGSTPPPPAPRLTATTDSVLDRKDIDAVLIATPDHWHVPMMLDAVYAGKDVYCEKPMSHSICEGMRAIQGVRATDRIVQIGMQRRIHSLDHQSQTDGRRRRHRQIVCAKAQWNWIRFAAARQLPLPAKLDWDSSSAAPLRAMQPMIFRSWRISGSFPAAT